MDSADVAVEGSVEVPRKFREVPPKVVLVPCLWDVDVKLLRTTATLTTGSVRIPLEFSLDLDDECSWFP